MNPYYYRAIKYSWNEDRYRTPGVSAAHAMSELGADGATTTPRGFPAATTLKEKSGSSEEPDKAGRARTPDSVYLRGSPAAAGELAPHPFHIPTQWDSKNALRALSAPKFLVGLDLWALESGILDAAAALAKKYSAHVSFTHVLDGAKAEGDEIPRRLREFQPPHDFHSFTGVPAEVLLREARHQQASLLLLATHGRRGKERVLLGSVAEEVLKQADIPVLIHRPDTHWPQLTKILVPFENLRGALPAIGPATKLCRGFGADLWMIHVRKDSETDSAGLEKAESLFAELPEGRSAVREIAPRGDVPESIAAFAESEGIDLLIMPSQREDQSKKILPGGVAAQVMRKVHCSVLVVPK